VSEENEREPAGEQPASTAQSVENRPRFTYVGIRFGMALERGVFSTELPDLKIGERCIIKSRRGIEWGEVTEIVQDAPETHPEGRVLRRPSDKDVARIRALAEEGTEEEFAFCKEKIAEHGLPMNLVGVEKIFSGDKIVFYFTAMGRVDFRGLVRTLAQAYRKRIELKQIGVRDEAKLLGTVGHCGRELCCRSFMRNIEQVTMKMAKVQKSTLDPTKISGRCGRLMCCLRFEDDTYRAFKKMLPSRGSKVWTEKGQVDVLDQRILSRSLFVRGPAGDRYLISIDDVREGPPPARESSSGRPSHGESRKPAPSPGRSEGRGGDRQDKRGEKSSGNRRPRRSRGRGGKKRSGDGGRRGKTGSPSQPGQGAPSSRPPQGGEKKSRRGHGRRRRRPRKPGGGNTGGPAS